jgi:hypothetical protein
MPKIAIFPIFTGPKKRPTAVLKNRKTLFLARNFNFFRIFARFFLIYSGAPATIQLTFTIINPVCVVNPARNMSL